MQYGRIFLITLLSLFAFVAAFMYTTRLNPKSSGRHGHSSTALLRPWTQQGEEAGLDNDWFMTQRSYPNSNIPANAFQTMKSAMVSQSFSKQSPEKTFASNSWTLVGPTNTGGRITALIIHPSNPNIIYAGAASGGVWKSTNFGSTWNNVFNESFSIGALAFDPTDTNTIYVGTGEANPAGVATYPGNGIWRSTNGGGTWANLGLGLTAYIGKVVINPLNTNELFVAALGLYRDKTQDRGVYKSTDKGATWVRAFFLNDTTGATDVAMDPLDTNRIFVAMWTRYRTPHVSILSSQTSGLYLSTNGGTTWNAVTNGIPSNNVNTGRMSITFAPSSPSTMYILAALGANWDGVYKSTNSGLSWTRTFNGASSGESQVWYNNIILVHPTNPNLVWAGMTSLYKSADGGATFPFASFSGPSHVDYHAMAYAPSNANMLVVGDDGGVFTSFNGGASWTKSLNLPITQFYAGWIDAQNPSYVLGGTQDNNTIRSATSVPNSWSAFYGGDGFYCLVDPTDANYVYAESQNGGVGYSTNGGSLFTSVSDAAYVNDRHNWSTPIAMDLQHPKTLYIGTQRVFRTKDNFQSVTPISNDLTFGNGGKVGTISTINVSQTDSNVVYVGTDDGRVWVTTNGGVLWQDISAMLPVRWVTRVTADPTAANIAYVTLSGFIENEYGSHVYRTTNYGSTWTNIGSTLPNVPVNDIVIDELNTDHLFIATDLNVMYSLNLGATWNILGDNLPETSVQDIAIYSFINYLVAFTHGRSAFSFDLSAVGAGTTTINVQLQTKWNLISNPLQGNNDSVHSLFPKAIGSAFAYTTGSGYQTRDSIIHGRGYWIKYPDSLTQSVSLNGTFLSSDTVPVSAGWNLIGSLSSKFPASNITPIGTTILSHFFGYSTSYNVVDTIVPGEGYWVKVDQNGSLVMNTTPANAAMKHTESLPMLSSLDQLIIRDAAGREQRLYIAAKSNIINLSSFELPPVPPTGGFDARFLSNRNVETVTSGSLQDFPIHISSAEYPLHVSWVSVTSNISSKIVTQQREEELYNDASVTISDPEATITLRITNTNVPLSFSLEQNYPNPFNPTTTIEYELPEPSSVQLRVVDIAGKEVATLVNGVQSQGSHSFRFDATNIASGIYFYRLEATRITDPLVSFTQIKKMLLVK
jgi:hypothetical protein